MSPACSLEITHDGPWNSGDWAEQGKVERPKQGLEVPWSRLLVGKNHQSPEAFLSLPASVGFVFFFTFHKSKEGKMNSLGEAGVGTRKPTLSGLFFFPLAYCFHVSLSLLLSLLGERG